MAVQLTDDVHWLPRCTSEGDRHVHASAYLIDVGDHHVLVDSGPRGDDTIGEEIDDLTDGAGVDTVVFTHSSLPHTGNAADFHARGARIISSTTLLAEMDMEYAEEWLIDQDPVIHGRQFSFVKPVFSDHIFSQWIYDHGSGVLFPSETFGNYHAPGACERVWTDGADPIEEATIEAYCHDRLSGMQYVLPELLGEAIRARLDPYDVRFIAPSHGTPIAGEHVEAYVDRLLDVATRFSQDWLYFRMND